MRGAIQPQPLVRRCRVKSTSAAWAGLVTFLIGCGAAASADVSFTSAAAARDSDGQLELRFAEGVLTPAAVQRGVLYENGTALRWIPAALWSASRQAGTFTVKGVPPVSVSFIPSAKTPTTARYEFKYPRVAPEILEGSAKLVLLAVLMLWFARRIRSEPNPRDNSIRAPFEFGHWSICAIAALAAIKLFAVRNYDIVSELYDAAGYADSAIHLVWGQRYLPSHPPGFPFVAGSLARIGISWRVVVEILFLIGCGVVSRLVGGLLRSRTVPVVLFAAMAFNPWAFRGFNEFMPYPLVSVIYLGLAAIAIHLLEPERRWGFTLFICLGLLLFFWQWARTEDPLVYISYALIAIAAWTYSKRRVPASEKRRRLLLLAIPALVSLLLISATTMADYVRFGIAGRSHVSDPGLLRLMSSLYRIDPAEKILYAPVTRESLRSAVRSSPTLQLYGPALLDSTRVDVKIGEFLTRRVGEFGPWLDWLLTGVISQDYPEGNRVMLTASREIDQALTLGILPSRRSFFPFDPLYREWVPELPRKTAAAALAIASSEPHRYLNPANDARLDSIFDAAAARRKHMYDASKTNIAEHLAVILYWPVQCFLVLLTFITAIRPRARIDSSIVLAAATIVSGLVVLRAGLFGLFEANTGVPSIRYMRLLSPFFPVALTLLTAALAGYVSKARLNDSIARLP